MPGVAGRKALVRVVGAGIAFVTEACTNSGDNLNYQITNTIKRIWDPNLSVTVFSNAVLQAASTYKLNRLTGKITFAASQGANPVTVTGTYLPTAISARAKSYQWSLEATLAEDNDFDGVNTLSGWTSKVQQARDIKGSVVAKITSDQYFQALLLNGGLAVLEFFPDRTAAHDIICWAIMDKEDVQISLTNITERSIAFVGEVDIDGNVAAQ